MKVSIDQLPDTARVWIYQNKRPLSHDQQTLIQFELDRFVSQWSAHNQPLAAHAEIRHDRFVILMVDEGQNLASGCSIDASVHFIRSLEASQGLDLFDRMFFSYWKDESVHTVSKVDFANAYAKSEIDDQTLVFDNLIKTKGQLDQEWCKPLSQSWHRRFVKQRDVEASPANRLI